MRVDAAGARLALSLPNAHPFSISSFEALSLGFGGEVSRGKAVRSDGSAAGVAAGLELPDARVSYVPEEGLLLFEASTFAPAAAAADAMMPKILDLARVGEGELRYAEGQVSFMISTDSTALKHLAPHLPRVPKSIEALLPAPLVGWGHRFVPETAASETRAFREVTPWFELYVEPFADNPRRIYVRALIREAAFGRLRDRVRDFEAVLPRLLDGLMS